MINEDVVDLRLNGDLKKDILIHALMGLNFVSAVDNMEAGKGEPKDKMVIQQMQHPERLLKVCSCLSVATVNLINLKVIDIDETFEEMWEAYSEMLVGITKEDLYRTAITAFTTRKEKSFIQ